MTLIRRLTADPVRKHSDDDRLVCQIRLADTDWTSRRSPARPTPARSTVSRAAIAVAGQLVYRESDASATRRSPNRVGGRVRFPGRPDQQPANGEAEDESA